MPDLPKLTKRHRELFRLFQLAIDSERQAQQLYVETKATCDDPDLREILEGFHQEEVKHEKALLRLYKEHRAQFAADGDE